MIHNHVILQCIYTALIPILYVNVPMTLWLLIIAIAKRHIIIIQVINIVNHVILTIRIVTMILCVNIIFIFYLIALFIFNFHAFWKVGNFFHFISLNFFFLKFFFYIIYDPLFRNEPHIWHQVDAIYLNFL